MTDVTETTEQAPNAEAPNEETPAEEIPADEQPKDDSEQAPPAGEQPKDEPAEETPEEEPTDDLPEWAREKLTKANAEAANYRTKLREAENKLKDVKTLEEVDALIAEFKAEREDDEKKSADQIRELLVENIARQYKLPAKLSKRLSGNTREELEADAKELAEFGEDDDEITLEGGLSPRNRDEDANLGPRELNEKYGRRKRR